MGFNKLKSSTRRTTHLAEDPQMPKHRKLGLISEQGKEGGRNKMSSFERILWLVFGIGCLLIIVILILLIVLWPYRELVGQLAIGLQTRIAAPEPAKWRRRARSRRRRRLPFHTKGVGLAFHPSTVCSNQSMICWAFLGC